MDGSFLFYFEKLFSDLTKTQIQDLLDFLSVLTIFENSVFSIDLVLNPAMFGHMTATKGTYVCKIVLRS